MLKNKDTNRSRRKARKLAKLDRYNQVASEFRERVAASIDDESDKAMREMLGLSLTTSEVTT